MSDFKNFYLPKMRRDGRSTSSLRELSISLENLDRVDGSATFAFGDIKAIASVSGPIQVRLVAELPSKAAFEVTVRPLSGIPGVESKSTAAMLRSLLAPSVVLTKNPRTLIQLVVQSLTPASSMPNPSLQAAFVNVATLALIRASSFPMLGVVCSVGVARLKKELAPTQAERLILDPDEDELRQSDALGCVAVMFHTNTDRTPVGETVWSSFQGAPLQDDYDALLRLAKDGCLSVYQAIRVRFQEDVDRQGVSAEKSHPLKKMPKFKGARVAQIAGGEDERPSSRDAITDVIHSCYISAGSLRDAIVEFFGFRGKEVDLP